MSLKKSFTLVEILVSITLFSIIMVFLYSTFDIAQKTNNFYSKKVDEKLLFNNIKKIFFLDLINKLDDVTITKYKNSSIVSVKTTNIYHNPFYQYVTYFISRDRNLIRIESKDKFDKNKLTDKFFLNSYIDILLKDIVKFKVVKQKNGKLTFFIENNKKEKIIFGF